MSPSGLEPTTHIVTTQSRTTAWSGPTPDPETLERYNKLYPDAAKIIFESYTFQVRHRAELEKMAFEHGITVRSRGQIIGGIIGFTGIVGSLIAVALGGGWPAATIGGGTLVSLVTVFVTGRSEKKQESKANDKVQKQIERGEPLEAIERG